MGLCIRWTHRLQRGKRSQQLCIHCPLSGSEQEFSHRGSLGIFLSALNHRPETKLGHHPGSGRITGKPSLTQFWAFPGPLTNTGHGWEGSAFTTTEMRSRKARRLRGTHSEDKVG